MGYRDLELVAGACRCADDLGKHQRRYCHLLKSLLGAANTEYRDIERGAYG